MMTLVKKCTCEHGFQDRQYGEKMRLHNVGIQEVTCTVCGKKSNKPGN